MTEVTRILAAIEQGDPHAAGELLPLVYDELRHSVGCQSRKPAKTRHSSPRWRSTSCKAA
jgi:hypothetical protein